MVSSSLISAPSFWRSQREGGGEGQRQVVVVTTTMSRESILQAETSLFNKAYIATALKRMVLSRLIYKPLSIMIVTVLRDPLSLLSLSVSLVLRLRLS